MSDQGEGMDTSPFQSNAGQRSQAIFAPKLRVMSGVCVIGPTM